MSDLKLEAEYTNNAAVVAGLQNVLRTMEERGYTVVSFDREHLRRLLDGNTTDFLVSWPSDTAEELDQLRHLKEGLDEVAEGLDPIIKFLWHLNSFSNGDLYDDVWNLRNSIKPFEPGDEHHDDHPIYGINEATDGPVILPDDGPATRADEIEWGRDKCGALIDPDDPNCAVRVRVFIPNPKPVIGEEGELIEEDTRDGFLLHPRDRGDDQ